MQTIKNLNFCVTTPFREMPKARFSLGTHNVGFILQAMGCSPIVFHDVSVGSHFPFKRYRVPHFLPNLTHFNLVDLHLFLPTFFQFLYCVPQFWAVFMLRASLLTPNFFSFYLLGCLWHPSNVTVLNRQWLRDAATTKNWVPSKNLSSGPLPYDKVQFV